MVNLFLHEGKKVVFFGYGLRGHTKVTWLVVLHTEYLSSVLTLALFVQM